MKFRFCFVLFSTWICLGFGSVSANATRDKEVQGLLDEVARDPAAFEMEGARSFPKEKSVLKERAERQAKLLSENRRNDRAEDLVDELRYSTLQAMESEGLRKARLTVSPWSDTYWPVFKGLTAQRYADPTFPQSSDWRRNADYLEKNLGQSSVEFLSPAEKYDLLTGDSEFTLTKTQLDEGRRHYDRTGKVEAWMGICHGWAPASYMVPRPEAAIQVLAADGRTKIPFYPADLKALASLLWANGTAPTRFIGGRCNEKKPEEDPLGRPSNPDCLDTNPGTWHLSIVNQLGVAKRSLVMDADYSWEVWNQPLLAYSYSYFNPKAKRAVETVEQATVAVADFPEDRYRTVRSNRAVAVVGIAMDVFYIGEVDPVVMDRDGPELDRQILKRWLYDVEIDVDRNIVGGEWYQKAHPDFLWTPVRGARVETLGDDQLANEEGVNPGWNGKDPLSESWRRAARLGAQRSQPLRKIVDALIVLSKLHS